MKIWAIADLHLAKGVPEKNMAVFGSLWEGYMDKIEGKWKALIASDDLVLIPGDISWAMKAEDAAVDLNWIHSLPGTKLILRGNHDYWWPSSLKLSQMLPSSIHFIHNNSFLWNGVAIGGARLWDTDEYSYSDSVLVQTQKHSQKEQVEFSVNLEENRRIFSREVERLKMSLNKMNPHADMKVVMTHYPPIGPDLKPSVVSGILEAYGVDICVFGHLHSLRLDRTMLGSARGVQYRLVAADFIDFTPVEIVNRF